MSIGTDGDGHASCKLLESRLDLSYDTIDVCCGFNESPIRVPFKDFNLLDLQRMRRETQARIQDGTEQTCLTCPQLKKKTWASSGLIESINIHHFTKCNLRCVYCFTVIDDQKLIRNNWETKYSAYDIIKSVIDAGQLSPKARVIWAGGEPTIVEEFDRVVQLVTEFGAYVDVFSNCVRFSPALAQAIGRTPARVHILCSVDAGTPATYEHMKGADVLHKVWHNIGLYNKDRPAVNGKYIFVNAENRAEEEIDAFVMACGQAGIRRVVIDVDQYQVRANGWVTPDEFLPAVVRLGEALPGAGIWGSFGEGVRCRDAVSSQIIAPLLEKIREKRPAEPTPAHP